MKVFVGLLLMLVFTEERVRAQGCCTAGASSLGGFENGTQTYRTLSATFNYQYNSLSSAFLGRTKIDDPLRREAQVAYVTLQLEYGLQPRLSVLGSLYYGDKTRELTVESGQGSGTFTETVSFRGTGIGDLTFLVKYQAVSPTVTSPFRLAIGFGASLPTGSYTEERDGAILSIDLQPGSGATTLIGWGFVGYSMPEEGLRFFLTGTYHYAGPNLQQYRFGDEILTVLGAERNVGEYFAVSLLLRSRFAAKDYAGGRFLGGTGGTYHDLMPGFSHADGPSAARLFGQLPLYRNVRGIQTTTTYLLGVEYRYTFDFRDIVDVIVPELD